MSHSIHMLRIQIDTITLELVIQHQFNNIKSSFFAGHIKEIFQLRSTFKIEDTLKYPIVVSEKSVNRSDNR